MAETLRIFVSATQDLEEERAVIGQALADLPVDVPAEIRRSPPEGLPYMDLFERIANVDRVYFLLGRDITAPAGAEWDLAVQLERSIMALRTPGPRTPAGEAFLQGTPVLWKVFHSRDDLARLVTLDLLEILLHPRNRYGLHPDEVLALEALRRSLQERSVRARAEAGGAEGGGVLLGRPTPG